MAKLITKENIENGDRFIIKWSKVPSDSGVYNPGWKQQTEADQFLELIENRPSIMNDARFIQMEALQHDVSYLKVDVGLVGLCTLIIT